MAGRQYILIRALPLSALVLFLACSQATRYRTLSFFFDGVPPPGTSAQPVTTEQAIGVSAGESATDVSRLTQIPRTPIMYAHPPYRNNRCGTCHNPDGGQLFKTAKEGLCLACHAALTRDPVYVHGPAAVNDCLFCHHHHSAPHPKVLLHETTETCLRCHDRADLGKGDHHATIGRDSCTVCHDPHGGANRLFLKKKRRAEP